MVTQWKPPHKLAYTWNVFAPGEEVSPYPQSYLTLELAPEGDQVRLTLTHLPVLPQFEKQNAMGWHTYLDMTAAAVRGEPIEPRGAYMQRNAALYGVDLANSCSGRQGRPIASGLLDVRDAGFGWESASYVVDAWLFKATEDTGRFPALAAVVELLNRMTI